MWAFHDFLGDGVVFFRLSVKVDVGGPKVDVGYPKGDVGYHLERPPREGLIGAQQLVGI